MIPDFPHNIRIRLALLKTFLLRPDVKGRNKKKLIEPILFLYYEESLVSSNLNSNLLRFHCAHPNVGKRTFDRCLMVKHLLLAWWSEANGKKEGGESIMG